jgi:hypothetical protein
LSLKEKELRNILEENAEETLAAPKIKKQQIAVGNCIPNRFRIGITSEAMRWVCHVACMELSARLW